MNSFIIKKAYTIAQNSEMKRAKVGAILFTNSRHIITFANNVYYDGNNNKRSIHAEEYVLIKAIKLCATTRFINKGLNLLVVRYKKSTDKLAMAKPCKNCAKLLQKFPKIKVYYSDEKGEIVKYE
jgi:deoxycytidylate deaminase